ncbi:hypothetical protein CO018_03235 [Candidatus Beckwithbacteria bacterium CG_4_9_14_0_2_um_filter_47_11]|uniref:Transposase n=1 Tax=Candidatus Beckwithbacteria bacterium CG_4_9_14_0_2_um_filter_47_11 TaxID=1974494 RepID=A0A2M8G3G7_9BACT|nr:MAG: hypothetical protein CO018_03235 [Candidatus Beckwithbacteria bacterium CG_4_9_14_0_2_um_filter_47_11]
MLKTYAAKKDLGHRYGRQRYRCLSCGYVFKRQKHHLPVSFRDFRAFRQYAIKTVDKETLWWSGFFREYGGGPQNSPIRATRRLRAVSLGLTEINSPADKDCDDVATGIFEA